ncbi:hypothetical protein L950_0219510 [Sphingobacterium sp. IITKGP-BTPF85]|nr:hypothetical protein L950_0219510 [Sphingobacterium sp. IITKGP-BTPF85]
MFSFVSNDILNNAAFKTEPKVIVTSSTSAIFLD